MLWSSDAGELLRGRGPFAPSAVAAANAGDPPWGRLLRVAAASAVLSGAMLGAFGGASPQLLLSALKVPLLLAVSTALALPSLAIVVAVSGVHRDLGAVLRAVLCAQASVAVALEALGPLLLLVYLSTRDYTVAKAAAGAAFLLASVAGQRVLLAHYAPLLARDRRHRAGRLVWWFLQALVTIQLAWVLRPFVGAPDLPFQLFRPDAWGNAFLEVGGLLVDLIRER